MVYLTDSVFCDVAGFIICIDILATPLWERGCEDIVVVAEVACTRDCMQLVMRTSP